MRLEIFWPARTLSARMFLNFLQGEQRRIRRSGNSIQSRPSGSYQRSSWDRASRSSGSLSTLEQEIPCVLVGISDSVNFVMQGHIENDNKISNRMPIYILHVHNVISSFISQFYHNGYNIIVLGATSISVSRERLTTCQYVLQWRITTVRGQLIPVRGQCRASTTVPIIATFI